MCWQFTFASGGSDKIKKWQLPKGKFLQNLEGHKSIINCMALNADDVLVSGGDNGTLSFWDYTTGCVWACVASLAVGAALGSPRCVCRAVIGSLRLRPRCSRARWTARLASTPCASTRLAGACGCASVGAGGAGRRPDVRHI